MNVCQEHEFVDLGLPSGTLWATCNVGARKPEDYGDYVEMDERDKVTINNGDDCNVPSKEQWEELIQNTKSTWMVRNGVKGRSFIARNGASIFLPAAGFHWDYKSHLVGETGSYWSSSLFVEDPTGAWCLGFSSNNDDICLGYDAEYVGLSVRLVASAYKKRNSNP